MAAAAPAGFLAMGSGCSRQVQHGFLKLFTIKHIIFNIYYIAGIGGHLFMLTNPLGKSTDPGWA